jgi:hypothetical protein
MTIPAVPRVFLLSPANCGGRRGKQLVSPKSGFDVARRLASTEGVSLGELFSFVSGLYFRGKLTYARRFAALPDPPDPVIGNGIHIITSNAGLRSPDTLVTRGAVEAFASGDIDVDNAAYRRPLERSARALARALGDSEVVLLGSIASPKYVDILLGIFADRLLFPSEFVGRGDMSRGGLLLRHAAEGRELEYIPVAGAMRRGVRPPKLDPSWRAPR